MLDAADFPEAERSGLRLDGDVFLLADALVPADLPVVPALRAAALLPEAARPDLVAAGRTAAWVHGVTPILPRPCTWTLDVSHGRRTRAVPTAREVRYDPSSVERLGGLTVTTPLRTAFDLAVIGDLDPATARLCAALLGLASLDAAALVTATSGYRRSSGRPAAVARLIALLDQPAETRYTS